MNLTPLEIFLLLTLATYRLTFLLNSEQGPGDLFAKLRTRLGVRYDEHSRPYGTNWIAEGVLCFLCLSVWVAIFLVAALVLGAFLHVLDTILIVLLPFAVSGGAIYLKKQAG